MRTCSISDICKSRFLYVTFTSIKSQTPQTIMLNIMSLKKKAAENGPKRQKTSAAQIRVQKGKRVLTRPRADSIPSDLSDLDALPKTMNMTFPDPNDIFNFELSIKPDEGTGLDSPRNLLTFLKDSTRVESLHLRSRSTQITLMSRQRSSAPKRYPYQSLTDDVLIR